MAIVNSNTNGVANSKFWAINVCGCNVTAVVFSANAVVAIIRDGFL